MRDPGSKSTADTARLARRVGLDLRRHCRVARGERLLVAVSGGSDSVALLSLLTDLAPRLGLGLEVAHFDHALRAESAADAQWVEELARMHGLASHVERWSLPLPGEAAARQARYEFLERTARTHDCNAIALGHHLDDQMETILMRLGRGVGLRGALGMAWRRDGAVPLVRPLLEVRRDVLRAYLAARDTPWREDSTNRDRAQTRNRIRHELVPALDATLGPQWRTHWQATWQDLRDTFEWLDAMAAELLTRAAAAGQSAITSSPPAAPMSRLHLESLRTAPGPVARLALQRWLDVVPDGIARAHLDDALRLIRSRQSSRRLELPGGWRLVWDQEWLWRHAPDHVEPVIAPRPSLGIETLTPDDARRALQVPPAATPDNIAILNADALVPPLQVRSRLAGDRMRLLGSPGHRSVARIFQDHRLPARLRAAYPVVADAVGVVWIPGVGVAERARIGDDTRSAVRVRLEGPSVGLPESGPAT